MDNEEARALLAERVAATRRLSYDALRRLMDDGPQTGETTGPSGSWYQWELEAFWDGADDADIRVIVSIDDGGWRAFIPMSDDFIKAPDNSFVDE